MPRQTRIRDHSSNNSSRRVNNNRRRVKISNDIIRSIYLFKQTNLWPLKYIKIRERTIKGVH